MNSRETQLWSYIDGTDTKEERKVTEAMLASDSSFYALYTELKSLNSFVESELAIDEPSMSFTRNVMDAIEHVPKPLPLKTKVSNTIIYAIAGVFAVSLVSLLAYAFASADFAGGGDNFSLANFDKFFMNETSLYVFLLMDAGLLLLFLDRFLRKNLNSHIKKGD
jgi:ABC-type glycerol-3-phosphate transport system permease component